MTKTHDDNCDCVACEKGWDKFWADTEEIIKKYGVMIIGTPAFSYTVGLSDNGLPEVLCLGLPPSVAQSILNDIAHLLRKGEAPTDEPIEGIVKGFAVYLKVQPAEKGVGYINVANSRAKHPVDFLQLVWPDKNGLFPWDKLCNARIRMAQTLMPGGV